LHEALVGTGVTAPTTFLHTVPTSGEPTDVARAQGGDTRAFERLYRTHVSRILALVRRMLGTDYAHEVTQDVFVRAWEKIGTFRGEAAFGTWLHRVAVSVVLHRRNALRLERTRIHDDEDALEAAPARPSTADLGMDFERAIVKLPAGARTVFVLHDVEGFKHEEIAEMLGVTSGTTKAQLHRARMILRQHLDR
jgi:RNA polymerase sigma-70 factor (ECF subfamily)